MHSQQTTLSDLQKIFMHDGKYGEKDSQSDMKLEEISTTKYTNTPVSFFHGAYLCAPHSDKLNCPT